MIELQEFDNKYIDDLEEMLNGLSSEVLGVSQADVVTFIEGHWAIYLTVDTETDKAIGFISFIIHNNMGLTDDTLGASYLYVAPAYRTGRAAYLLSIQIGHVVRETNLPVEMYYASPESKAIHNRRLTGERIYEAYRYSPVDIEDTYGKLIDKYNRKK